ncbi:hypothetical protein C0993_008210 [Termitomyces sp. T159_Od127]|nr:hypothetical protein C0993_008210 [Termitomyces sp. T159_Od127]
MAPSHYEMLHTFNSDNKFNGSNYDAWTISSTDIIHAHFKNTTPAQTAHAVWTTLKDEFQKDTHAKHFELKQRLYNPIHNIEQPVSVYIQDIISAYEALTALGHAPAAVDVVDSILMNLHSDFSIVRTLLTTQADEPTLATVKKVLTDQEDT